MNRCQISFPYRNGANSKFILTTKHYVKTYLGDDVPILPIGWLDWFRNNYTLPTAIIILHNAPIIIFMDTLTEDLNQLVCPPP